MTNPIHVAPHWQDGEVQSPAGRLPRVATRLVALDRLGHLRVRWGIGRMSYEVPPGLYAAGSPGAGSPVLVTANFKMSFDRLRSNLAGRDAWILVLDTKAINVWCAAGKGTFGTDELIRRVEATRLAEVVEHRKLILPQLGATGVSAHRVRERSGWRVVYGPVRAADLPAFLDAGGRADDEMRRVRFPLARRVELVPVEMVQAAPYLLLAAAALILLSGLGRSGYSLGSLLEAAPRSVLLLLASVLAGVAVVPALLPWLPGRAFSWKGAWTGLLAVLAVLAWGPALVGPSGNWAETGGWLLLGPAISSFLAMNFTGCSTYTSLSGVRREMKFAVPAQIAAAALGCALWIAGRFLGS